MPHGHAGSLPPFHDAYARAVYTVDHHTARITFTFAPASADTPAPIVLPFAEPWAIITACNPRSIPLTDADNAARAAALIDRLRRDNIPFFLSESRAPAAASPDTTAPWREHGVLIEHTSHTATLALLRGLDQHAAVFSEHRRPGLLYADGTFIAMTPLKHSP